MEFFQTPGKQWDCSLVERQYLSPEQSVYVDLVWGYWSQELPYLPHFCLRCNVVYRFHWRFYSELHSIALRKYGITNVEVFILESIAASL